jgi:glycosyltransferase involved in cell wall biosynthesis
MPRILFVQRQVSQMDEPVYGLMHQLDPDSCFVFYWNNYGYRRAEVDPELGYVPDFDESEKSYYPREWIDERSSTWRDILRSINKRQPQLVVLSDIPLHDRLLLAASLRARSIKVAFRSDANHISPTARTGCRLFGERLLTHLFYNYLAPVSPLTNEYYAWPEDSKQSVLFPYSTDVKKFAPQTDVRLRGRTRVRDHLGISEGTHVFLAAAKFSERENPWAIIRSYERLYADGSDVYLLALGDGPLLKEIQNYCVDRHIERIHFPGYVPFRDIQEYFFAADTFLHFAHSEPWGVSPQDALVTGLSLITSHGVGSGEVFLTGALSEYLVDSTDVVTASQRMRAVADEHFVADTFSDAQSRAFTYSADNCARAFVSLNI